MIFNFKGKLKMTEKTVKSINEAVNSIQNLHCKKSKF